MQETAYFNDVGMWELREWVERELDFLLHRFEVLSFTEIHFIPNDLK